MAYEGLLRVGLLMRGPGVPAGEVIRPGLNRRPRRHLRRLCAASALPTRATSTSLQAADRKGCDARLRLPQRMGPARLALRRRPLAAHGAHGDPQAHPGNQFRRRQFYDLVNDPQEMDNRFGDTIPATASAWLASLEDMIRSRPKDRDRVRCLRSGWPDHGPPSA